MHRVGVLVSSVLLSMVMMSCGGGGGDTQPLTTQVVNPSCTVASLSPTVGSPALWTYRNTASVAVSVTATLPNVVSGREVAVVFSNGSEATASNNPGFGVAADISQFVGLTAFDTVSTSPHAKLFSDPHGDEAHTLILEKNRLSVKKLLSTPSTGFAKNADQSNFIAPLSGAQYAPALNSQKIWIENSEATPSNYATTAMAVCATPSGRNVIVWMDAQSISKVAPSSAGIFANTYCGANGAFAKITTLLGDAWGAHKYDNLIQDAPSLQDINIVVISPPATAGWAGHFSNANNFLKKANPASNEALALFINSDQLQVDLNFTLSTLLHETTHMIDFYQHSVARGNTHDTWLSETFAMMTEDIVAPTIICKADNSSYNKIIEQRLPRYINTGGAVSYINWGALGSANPNYYIGASFGAFLNRRFGIGIYQQLISNCNDGPSSGTSYACLDTLIKNAGGAGFTDEFARFGTSIFGAMPAIGSPAGYAYPAITTGGYNLMPIDVPMLTVRWRPPAPNLLFTNGFTATSHVYSLDTVPMGSTSYKRGGIVVPANTTVSVVVR